MKLIAIAATSLDGFITRGEEPGTAFTSEADKRWFSEAMKAFPVKVMGRKTFEVSRAMILGIITQNNPGVRIVMTRSPEQFLDLEIPGRLHFTDQPPREILNQIEEMGYRDSQVAILGGSYAYSAFLDAGLVEEFWITLEPQMFGTGTPLLHTGSQTSLKLKECIELGPSTLLLKYDVTKYPV